MMMQGVGQSLWDSTEHENGVGHTLVCPFVRANNGQTKVYPTTPIFKGVNMTLRDSTGNENGGPGWPCRKPRFALLLTEARPGRLG